MKQKKVVPSAIHKGQPFLKKFCLRCRFRKGKIGGQHNLPPQPKYTTVNRKSQNLCQDLCTYLGTQVGTQKNNKTFYNPSGGDGLVCGGKEGWSLVHNREEHCRQRKEAIYRSCNHERATPEAIRAKREYLEKLVIPRTQKFVKGHCLVNRITGKTTPLEMLTRSNYLAVGREKVLRVFWARWFKIISATEEYKELPKFLTLTVARSETSGLEQRKAVNRVMSRLRYQAKKHGRDGKLVYIKVAEVQERGVIHYHFVLLGLPYLPKAYWSDVIKNTWRIGYIFNIKCIYGEKGIAKYASKYIAKSIDTKSEEVPEDVIILRIYGVRRYAFSIEGRFEKTESSGNWELCALHEVHLASTKLDYLEISQKSEAKDRAKWLREAILSEYEGLTIQEAARKLRKIAISANVIQA